MTREQLRRIIYDEVKSDIETEADALRIGLRYALSGRDEYVMMKVVVDRKTDRVLGVHMVGPDAPEIIQTIAIAVTMGATKADLDRTFALHPTTAEELVLLR